jgi:hypothetical protein
MFICNTRVCLFLLDEKVSDETYQFLSSFFYLVFYSAELETRLRLEKALALKQVDNRIIALKRDINKLKDILVEYGTYEVGP